jgi:hypothetical protein
MAAAYGDIQQYKIGIGSMDQATGIVYQVSAFQWGQVYWGPFDPGQNNSANQILRNFFAAKAVLNGPK